jgi:hypothetical protein
MKLRLFLAVFIAIPLQLLAAIDPISFEEISVRLRIGDKLASIMKDVDRRKLLYPLTNEQISVLSSLGSPRDLLVELQRPERVAPRELSDAVVRRKQQARNVLVTANPEVASRTSPPVPSALPPKDGITRRLVVEKIIVRQEPLHLPFCVYFQVSANNGQTAAEFNEPAKKFELQGIDPKVEIPVNLVLNDVRENDWAKVNLQLDIDPGLVNTTGARKKHFGRLPITDTLYYGSPFSLNPSKADYIVSENTNQGFRYEVYWHLE